MNISTKLGFILGRDQRLSVAEIFAYLARIEVTPISSRLIENVLILELSEGDANKVKIGDLGGTIKICEFIGDYASKDEIIEKLLVELPKDPEKRVNFGISSYGRVPKDLVTKIGHEIKGNLTKSGHSARFVTGKTAALSSVIVTENKLIERGFEAIIIPENDGYLLGKTLAVQDYKAYSRRDFGRPKRDDRNGMLPPKLAQIMINLARKPVGSSVYDPFCGSGTILQEALFLGYRNIYGSDIEEKNIAYTKENLSWLYQAFGMPKVADDHVFVSDVLSPSHCHSREGGNLKIPDRVGDDKLYFDAIVGEGYLGEPVRRDTETAKQDANDLTEFYLKALVNLKSQLSDDGTIVLAVPFFVVGKDTIYLKLIEKLPELGLEIVNYLPATLNLESTTRNTLTYSRPDQFVGREILVLKVKSNAAFA